MKAIVIIDMPERCGECPLSCAGDSPSDLWHCNLEDRYLQWSFDRPDWCPLKPMPKKKPVWRIAEILADNVEKEINSNQTQYARGWNDCLDAIGGKE